MNSKEIVKALQDGVSFNEIFKSLMDDAEKLIQARRATTPEAKRSCYLEADSKWRSACSKYKPSAESNSEALNPEAALEHMQSEKRLQSIFQQEHPKHRSSIREQIRKMEQYNEAIDKLGEVFLKDFTEGVPMCEKISDERNLSLTDDQIHEAVTETAIDRFLDSMIKTCEDNQDVFHTCTMIAKGVMKARESNHKIPEKYTEYVGVFDRALPKWMKMRDPLKELLKTI